MQFYRLPLTTNKLLSFNQDKFSFHTAESRGDSCHLLLSFSTHFTMNIFDAIKSQNVVKVKELLEQNPDCVNHRDERGSSPLLLATYLGDKTIIDILLAHTSNVDARDAMGNTALMGVCFKGYVDVAQALIEAGADVNALNSGHTSALTFAAMFGKDKIIQLLLSSGADPNIKDQQGMTALDHAKAREQQQVVAILSPLTAPSNG